MQVTRIKQKHTEEMTQLYTGSNKVSHKTKLQYLDYTTELYTYYTLMVSKNTPGCTKCP